MSNLVPIKDMFGGSGKKTAKKTVKKKTTRKASTAKKKSPAKKSKPVKKSQEENLEVKAVEEISEVKIMEDVSSLRPLSERIEGIENFDKRLHHIRKQLSSGDGWDDVKSVFNLTDEEIVTFKEYINEKKKEKFYELKTHGGEIDIIDQYDMIIKDLFSKYNEHGKASDRNYYVTSLLSAIRDRTKFLKEIGIVKKDRGLDIDGKSIENMSLHELNTNIHNMKDEIVDMKDHREAVMEADITQPEVGRYTDIKTAYTNDAYEDLNTDVDDPFFDQKMEKWLAEQEKISGNI